MSVKQRDYALSQSPTPSPTREQSSKLQPNNQRIDRVPNDNNHSNNNNNNNNNNIISTSSTSSPNTSNQRTTTKPYHIPSSAETSPSKTNFKTSISNNMINNDHQFDPEDSPQQKNLKALNQISGSGTDDKALMNHLKKPITSLKTDLDAVKIEQPSVSIEEIRSATLSETDSDENHQAKFQDQKEEKENSSSNLQLPGQIEDESLNNNNREGKESLNNGNGNDSKSSKVVEGLTIPDWYRIGWAAQINSRSFNDLDGSKDPEEVKHLDILESFISEMYYGSWYHNAAIIFFAVAATHYITLFGGGWSSLIIILSICGTYYQTSLRRTRREARGDISRELSKQRLFQDHETVDWLNNFLSRFWLIYEPVLSATIVASVDQVLVASTPTFLESIRMSTFTLGSKSPRIEFIRSHPETENDVVVMDWKFDFTPNDLSDLTSNEILGKINPKIVLTIKFGKGLIGAAKDIVVENITFCGVIRIRIKLMNNFPHLQLVDLSFLEKPEFDFVLKPVGFDLNMIPGLSSFIESQVHATLGPMMYDPNVFTLNLEQMLAGTPIDSAVGVLQIKLYNARGLKAVKIGGGTPDPYLTFSVGTRVNLDRTGIKHSTQNPSWNTNHFILLNSLNDILAMEVMDYNEVRKDTSLGFANFDLQTLINDPEQEALTIPILHQGKPRGELRLDLTYHPCLVPKKLENGEEEPVPETMAGVTRLIIHQAKDLDYKRTGTGHLSPYAKVYLNGKQIFKTPVIKRTNNPVYESFTEALVTNKPLATFTVKFFDERSGEDPLIGQFSGKLTELLDLTNGDSKLDWFPLKGGKTGKVRMSVSWKGVLMAGAINGAGAYTPPFGVLKFWFKRAEDLKNVEALTGGKSDPYVRVMRSGITLARTQIHNNNLDPEFDEIIYVPIHRLKESLRLEVMDYQHLTKDRSLGIIDLEVNDLIEQTKGKEDNVISFKSTGRKSYSEFLKQEGKKSVVKGKLDFEVEFHPCSQIKFKPFDRTGSDLENLKTDQVSINSTNNHNGPTDPNQNKPMQVLNGNNSAQSVDRNNEFLETIVLDEDVKNNSTSTSRLNNQISNQSLNSNYTNHNQDLNSLTTTDELKSNNLGGANETDGGVRRMKSYGSGLSNNQRNFRSLTKAELLDHQSGIIVFNIMGGQIAKKNARLEFLFDDGYWPAYSTEPSKSANAKWDETGECFIRELDWSKCTMKLNVAEKETREEVYAEYSSGLKPFLEECLDEPHEFVLEDLDGGNRSTVMIQCRYVPVPITLEPRESINNMGILSIILENGKDLPSADRNGYSDPYVQFILNGIKVFKSSVQKKTLNPKWNERFEVEVPSRVHAEFVAQVFDWDRVGASDKIGVTAIDLKDLEPMQQSTHVFKLTQSDQTTKGQIQLKMTFRPGFITRSRQATSTFTGLGRVATGLSGTVLLTGAGVGMGAAKGVGHVGGGVIKGVGGVGKLGFAGIRKITGGQQRQESVIVEDSESVGPRSDQVTPNTERVNQVIGSSSFQTPSPGPKAKLVPTDFRLSLQIIGANGLESPDVRAYVHVKRNGKSVYETKTIRHSTSPVWEESFTSEVKVGIDTELELTIYDKKKLGRDKELGEIRTLNLWEIIEVGSGKLEVELSEPILEPINKKASGGTLILKLILVENLESSGGGGLNQNSSSPFTVHHGSSNHNKSISFSPKNNFLEHDPHGHRNGHNNQNNDSIDLSNNSNNNNSFNLGGGGGGGGGSSSSRPGSIAGGKSSSKSLNKFSLHLHR